MFMARSPDTSCHESPHTSRSTFRLLSDGIQFNLQCFSSGFLVSREALLLGPSKGDQAALAVVMFGL